MFNNYDNGQNLSNEHCADGQRLGGMDQFSIPMYDAWQSSIDFMLWPPGSCEYGSHVGTCTNVPTPTDSSAEQKVEDIPRSPWGSGLPSHCYMTTNGQSYCSPGGPASRQTESRGGFTPPDSPMSQQASIFRQRDIPLTTPVWRPNGPTQRFSERL